MPKPTDDNTLETFLIQRIISTVENLMRACHSGDARQEVLEAKINHLIQVTKDFPKRPEVEAKLAKKNRVVTERWLKQLLALVQVSFEQGREKADVRN